MAAAGGPTGLPADSWKQAFKRTIREFQRDDLTSWAAALTYYAVLSIFPAILVVVSLVGLAGRSATDDLIGSVGDLAPGTVGDLLVSSIRELQGGGGAGVVALLGLAGAVWSASGYVGAFMKASNVVYDVPEGRPIWKTVPVRIAVTLLALVMLAASVVAVVVSGPLAGEIGDVLGLGSQAVTAWNIAKWPVLLLVVSCLFSLLYWASPNAKRGFRWVTPGGLLAVALWLVASGLFALYVANFASYNKTYGSIAGIIIFLVWLWITNLAILLGAELNAELERGRAVSAGRPAAEEPYVEFRDTRAFDEEQRRETSTGGPSGGDDEAAGRPDGGARRAAPQSPPDAPRESAPGRRGGPGAGSRS
ncbi:YihY/virulence factor BrkB family protein [Actinomadura sp. 7K507]|uniref:YihY/virulence factor BrkB family protein n=1 Tax=Actinomadura sp. 7K507 TaxID=2530365 RepID=UPI00105198AB|nr:YihY/virulence factor BrkB family protein [Actinomadura sp. 7K507]TDC77683.1 YihY/virulence factor BrkB family protein [Actinomadura sp. 7K507]